MEQVAPTGSQDNSQVVPPSPPHIQLVAPSAESWLRLPADLRERPQWVLAGADKAPLGASLRKVSPTSPSDWLSFETACGLAAAHAHAITVGQTSGGVRVEQTGYNLGFVLHEDDPLACVDLDVKNKETHPDKPELWTTKQQLERQVAIVQTLDSYTERSRSGDGVHVWVKGSIGDGLHRDEIEVYSQKRFIICTGDVVHDKPVAGRQAVLDNMITQMRPAAAELQIWGDPCPDHDLATRASLDAGELGRLWRGEWEGRYSSQSVADLALVKLLQPQTASPRACWETFLLSSLGARDKAKRRDYARSTLGIAFQHLTADAAAIQHGREVASAMLQGGSVPPTASHASHLRLLLDDDLDGLPRLHWLVKGIIPDAGIGAIYGASGTFKSFLTLDLLAHISNGREWFGHRVRAAPAVYVPFEGQGGIPNRIRAWRTAQTAARYPDDLATFAPDADVLSRVAIISEPLNLRVQADRDRLVAGLEAQGWSGGILCIDTLAQAAEGIEENSSAMGEMIRIFRELQLRLGGVILLVHHSGKDETKGMRGWSGLHAAMDFVVECQREGDGDARAANFRLAKVKDGTTGTSFGFQMQVVHIGVDEDGDPITSLTLRPRTEPREQPEHPFKTDKGGKSDKATLRDIDADTSGKDDAFVEGWAREQVLAGNHPSRNSLKGQLPSMKAAGYRITQDRVLAAIERLIAAGRLVKEAKSQNGNAWLRPMDQMAGGSLAIVGFAGGSPQG